MQIEVRYFAALREQRGCEAETLEVEGPQTVSELYRRLFPPGPEGALPVMFAVNREYVRADHRLSGGEEVAFIPPLGGG